MTQRKLSGPKPQPEMVRALDRRDGNRGYFQSVDGDESLHGSNTTTSPPRVQLIGKLPFRYKGDVFSQRGSYSEASLYMSRLSPTRSAFLPRLRRNGPGVNYKVQIKLEPMNHQSSLAHPSLTTDDGSTHSGPVASRGAVVSQSPTNASLKSNHKQQYATAIAAMAANPALHASLLGDSAILASVMSMSRTKDMITLSACIATLGHLSSQPEGRIAILNHNALALLVGLSLSLHPRPQQHHATQGQQGGVSILLQDCVSILANLTIDDGMETLFVKEKGLESLLYHRKVSAFADRACTLGIFNLSCPSYSYPRVDDVVTAIVELVGRDRDHRELHLHGERGLNLSRALYNISNVKTNLAKVAEADTIHTLQLMIAQNQSTEARRNALATFWHIASGNPMCRRSIVRCCTGGSVGSDCIKVVVDLLFVHAASCTSDFDDILCILCLLNNLAQDEVARELMARAQALDALAALSNKISIAVVDRHDANGIQAVLFRLLAVMLSLPANIGYTSERVFQLLLSFTHLDSEERIALHKTMSRSALFSLASILSWSGDMENRSARYDNARQVPAYSLSNIKTTTNTTSEEIASPIHDNSLDEILDRADNIGRIYQHVAKPTFATLSTETYLQMLLLYNLSFRYNKLEVAELAFPRLLSVLEECQVSPVNNQTRQQHQRELFGLMCGTVFNLCQEYKVHAMLITPGGLRLQQLLMASDYGSAEDNNDSQRLCLDTLCILFDGRSVSRTELAQVVRDLFPIVRDICNGRRARLKPQVRAACGACLSRFASVDECRVFMVRQGVLASLSELADPSGDPSTGNSECLRHCATTYALLASTGLDTDPSIGAALIEGGIVKALTLLADAPEEAVRRVCAMVLCNLSTSEQNVIDMVKHGALRALLVISCVKSNDPETRRICMKAVLNLLRRKENVPQMCQEGLLWAITVFFTGGTETKTLAPTINAGSTTSNTTRDHVMLVDAFCALAYYPHTRIGMMKKPALVAPILRLLDGSSSASSISLTTINKIVGGILNLLIEVNDGDVGESAAPMLFRLGIVRTMLRLVDTSEECSDLTERVRCQGETLGAIAQILSIVFQICGQEAEVEYARKEIVRAIVVLLKAAAVCSQQRQWREQCSTSCALLLYLMSQLDRTRSVLIESVVSRDDDLWHSVAPCIFHAAELDFSTTTGINGRLLLLRCIYNISCDSSIIDIGIATRVLPTLSALLPSQSMTQLTLSAEIVGGTLRNLSAIPRCHEALTTDAATTLLREAFAIGTDLTKIDVALCTCNLFLGNVNSHELLERASLLPHVLWICTSTESLAPPVVPRGHGTSSSSNELSLAAIASAVLRKLSAVPGNVPELLDCGVPGLLVQLLRHSSGSSTNAFIKANCMACFCLLSQYKDAPNILASCGAITLALEALEQEQSRDTVSVGTATAIWHTHIEAMCLELLSTLAAFASASDPRESAIASTLFQLLERHDATLSSQNNTANTAWRSDRHYLDREENGDLPPTLISTTLRMPAKDIPTLRAALQPFAYRGHLVAFQYSPSYIEMRTIEPIVPSAELLLVDEEWADEQEVIVGNEPRSDTVESQRRPSRRCAHTPVRAGDNLPEWKPPSMYTKLRPPLAPHSASSTPSDERCKEGSASAEESTGRRGSSRSR